MATWKQDTVGLIAVWEAEVVPHLFVMVWQDTFVGRWHYEVDQPAFESEYLQAESLEAAQAEALKLVAKKCREILQACEEGN